MIHWWRRGEGGEAKAGNAPEGSYSGNLSSQMWRVSDPSVGEVADATEVPDTSGTENIWVYTLVAFQLTRLREILIDNIL